MQRRDEGGEVTGRVQPVVVRDVVLGEGRPKIVVPLTGRTVEELRVEVAALAGHPVDVVEWRADHFAELTDVSRVVSTARLLADDLAGRPLLFTCRTTAEGGRASLGDERYGQLILAVVESGAVDLVDVEYERDRAVVDGVLTAARERDVPVVASYHDFTGTPGRDQIVDRLRAMQDRGADICKIAVMPHGPADVLTLLEATRIAHERYVDRPLITMAMGPLGVVSRIAGQLVGSAATFGTVGRASAPGQVPVDALDAALRLLDYETNAGNE